MNTGRTWAYVALAIVAAVGAHIPMDRTEKLAVCLVGLGVTGFEIASHLMGLALRRELEWDHAVDAVLCLACLIAVPLFASAEWGG